MAPDIDHPVATDEIGTETFSFDAGLWSWRGFTEELVEYADRHGLEIAFERERGAVWGLMGVTVNITVTGRFSEITDFAAFAQDRAWVWRQGAAGTGGGP